MGMARQVSLERRRRRVASRRVPARRCGAGSGGPCLAHAPRMSVLLTCGRARAGTHAAGAGAARRLPGQSRAHAGHPAAPRRIVLRCDAGRARGDPRRDRAREEHAGRTARAGRLQRRCERRAGRGPDRCALPRPRHPALCGRRRGSARRHALGDPGQGAHLAPTAHVLRWVQRNTGPQRAELATIARDAGWESRPERTLGAASSIYLRLPDDFALWLARDRFERPGRAALQRVLSPGSL